MTIDIEVHYHHSDYSEELKAPYRRAMDDLQSAVLRYQGEGAWRTNNPAIDSLHVQLVNPSIKRIEELLPILKELTPHLSYRVKDKSANR